MITCIGRDEKVAMYLGEGRMEGKFGFRKSVQIY